MSNKSVLNSAHNSHEDSSGVFVVTSSQESQYKFDNSASAAVAALHKVNKSSLDTSGEAKGLSTISIKQRSKSLAYESDKLQTETFLPNGPLILTETSTSYRDQSVESLRSRSGSKQSLLQSAGNSQRHLLTHENQCQNCSELHKCKSCTLKSAQTSTSTYGSSNHHKFRSPVGSLTASVRDSTKMDKKQREIRKKDLRQKLDRWDRKNGKALDRSRCHWTFVFDPAGRLCYYWSLVVSLAFLYNFWVIIFRFSFAEITQESLYIWFPLDYFMDSIYFLDIVFHFRTGYLEDGVLQTDSTKLRQHYMNSTTFYIDCLCLLPLDFLYLSLGFNSILRIFRLVKVYQFWAFMDRSERHTNYPNLLRFVSLLHYLLLSFHWNACLFHFIYRNNGFGGKNDARDSSWSELRYPIPDDTVMTYLMSYYWTMLALTAIGDLPQPTTKYEYIFVILELTIGLIIFATVLGFIANIVTNVSAARKDFQAKLDGVKTYMRLRRVPKNIQNKVIKWFDYLWLTQKSSDEERAISCLPDKLKGEIAIHVHLDTLKRVEIFQNTEAGFLCELVLRLRPVLFSPGDYICRKGEVGKEMYICARGRLEVVVDEGKTVLATLKAGSYFGEISILNMGTAGNRRTASVRSVGYSDLFVLSKKDMWDVLKDYPAARVRLEAIAVKRLEKYKKAPLEKAALPRSESTPGLVESTGMTTLEDMYVSPFPLYNYTKAHPRHNSSPSGDSHTSKVKCISPETSSNQTSQISYGSNTTVNDQPIVSKGIQTNGNKMDPCSSHPQHHRHKQLMNAGGAALNHHHIVNNSSFSNNQYQDCPMTHSKYNHRPSIVASSIIHSSQKQKPSHLIHQQLMIPYNHGPSPLISGYHPDSDSSAQQPQQILSLPHPNHHHHHHHSNNDHSFIGVMPQTTTASGKEELLLEIRRLRERIKGLETDNASMHTKLSRTQKDVDQRLTEIEMQIQEDECSSSPTNSSSSQALIVCATRGRRGPTCHSNNHHSDSKSPEEEDEEEEEEEKNKESFI
ncbi:uncharacterized protein [Lepeophtheirus salmonis]|uniref:uncharacterized protein isoform X2 n=1 Tax=Lepeophtheirus salmonis TaxID=72036 RepID=UPI003AF385B0